MSFEEAFVCCFCVCLLVKPQVTKCKKLFKNSQQLLVEKEKVKSQHINSQPHDYKHNIHQKLCTNHGFFSVLDTRLKVLGGKSLCNIITHTTHNTQTPCFIVQMQYVKDLEQNHERLRMNIDNEKRVYILLGETLVDAPDDRSSLGDIPSAKDHYAQSAKVSTIRNTHRKYVIKTNLLTKHNTTTDYLSLEDSDVALHVPARSVACDQCVRKSRG